jgi:hypothetical protein
MQNWEYDHVQVQAYNKLIDVLTQYGSQGWELVTVTQAWGMRQSSNPVRGQERWDDWTLFFKRPKA